MAHFAVQDLTFSYPTSENLALDQVTLNIEQGEFVAVCGKSGCGKSTLLRHLKTVLTPHGKRSGNVWFDGVHLSQVSSREQASRIGFVLQDPNTQIVTDKVWHELAFGLENLGHHKETIRLRVAEMASFFGIQTWFHKSVFELSGGQKQLLNLAAVMAMQPDVLLLDEPTSQLDPIAAADFLVTLKKINSEIGTTIILSEHRLENVLPGADQVVVLSQGRLSAVGAPAQIGQQLKAATDPMLSAMPTPMRVFLELADNLTDQPCPVTVGEGRAYLHQYSMNTALNHSGIQAVLACGRQDTAPRKCSRQTSGIVAPVTLFSKQTNLVIALKDVWFRYEKNGEDVLRGLELSVKQGELYCIVGGNGTGKTTALNVISGLLRPYRGKVAVFGSNVLKASGTELAELGIAVLPQDPRTLFTRKTIREDLAEMLIGRNHEVEQRISEVAELAEIADLLELHPYDVSGGEQQRVALAKVILTEPKLLLLDEPTKGMDSFYKLKFADVLAALQAKGLTVIMVSHDLEFCAAHADRCALFFDGGIVTENTPREFFSGNSFYTTAANRMSRGILDQAITAEDIVAMVRCCND